MPSNNITNDQQLDHYCEMPITKTIKLCPRGATNLRDAVAKSGKVILDPHPEPDKHQNRTPFSSSPPAPTHQVMSRSVNPFRSYPADRYTDRYADTRRPLQYLLRLFRGAQVKSFTIRYCVFNMQPKSEGEPA